MATSTANHKRRRLGRKADDIRLVWKKQAPDAVFAGKTLADLEAALAASQESGENVSVLALARSAAQKTRDEEQSALNHLLVLVTHGVRSHPDHGEDSALYRSMGFVPKSERRSGLTRRSAAGSEDAAADESSAGNDEVAA